MRWSGLRREPVLCTHRDPDVVMSTGAPTATFGRLRIFIVVVTTGGTAEDGPAEESKSY
jgi:hypothetical protein